ncbi:uncharacterized protein LOC135334421 isoform X3 [Halichondria panicea]|uniref:uncharacterized protein LOC135334421 isoform X3 n=1 Tax=Halichondria panicea TaxID=6063 RepID=UPI00312B3EFA
MGLYCCLCANESLDNRRRKNLNGHSCSEAREVLVQLLPVPLHCIPETSASDSILCHQCEKQLKNVHAQQEKLCKVKKEATELINGLLSRHAEDNLLPPPPKRSRVMQEPPTPPIPSSVSVPTIPSVSAATIPPVSAATIPSASAATIPPVYVSAATIPPVSAATIPSASAAMSAANLRTTAATQLPSSQIPQSSSNLPSFEVVVPYSQQTRKYIIKTPTRQTAIRRLVRKSYTALTSGTVNSPRAKRALLSQLALTIKNEMKKIGTNKHDSILRDNNEAVKRFSWETVRLELYKMVPTLMSLLSLLIPNPENRIPLICTIASQLLKCRHQHLSLVQRVVSVMLYGHGTHKQVFSNLQPLNLCLSHKGSLNIVRGISQDYDVEVQEWRDKLIERIPKPTADVSVKFVSFSNFSVYRILISQYRSLTLPSQTATDADYSLTEQDVPLSELNASFSSDDYSHPDFSPITSVEDNEVDENVADDLETSLIVDDPQNQSDQSQPTSSSTFTWTGFKFVGDNLDKRVKPRYQRADMRGHEGHYFHGFAVRDRIDMCRFSEEKPSRVEPQASELLASSDDVSAYKTELEILISRILVEHMGDVFDSEKKNVMKHIPSKYSEEMASSSKTVPLSVLLLNENKLEEMSQILKHYMELVPALSCEGKFTLGNGTTITFDDTRLWEVLFGGDQLTVARIRGTQTLRDTEESPGDRLEGIIPVVEDWHTRMTFLRECCTS